MYHQREKYLQISLITLGLAIIICIIAIFKSYYLLVFLSLLLISISLIAEALLLNLFHRPLESLKQLVRASLIIILLIFLFIKLYL